VLNVETPEFPLFRSTSNLNYTLTKLC